MSVLKDGTGTGNVAKVSANNKLQTFSVTRSAFIDAIEGGGGFNLNTGSLNLTGTGESGIVYVKNNEDEDLVITAFACGQGNAATTTELGVIKLYRNPTAGTLISDATPIAQNGNMNFGNSKTLNADVFSGGEGKTISGGSVVAQFFQGEGSRLFATVPMILPKGSSMALSIDANISSGTMPLYMALICHLHEGANE